jgi:hypothetical protein
MDSNQFDRLSRLVGSRRTLGLALGAASLIGLAGGASARKKKKPCKHFRVRVTCRDRCGTFHNPNSCSRRKRCTCKRGKTCLANKSCGLTCGADIDCPVDSGCTCSISDPKVCLAAFSTCEDIPTLCDTTADCPVYSVCDDTTCGEGETAEKRCMPVCGHASTPWPGPY